ncbi:MAG: hypothetical protein U5K76_01855 [Woeseiaceae bacterium]|nr:hypothetical protein [Woeseiaceae bacterium]
MQGRSSNLPDLFDAWGLEFTAGDVVIDARLALQVSGPGGQPVRHLAFLGVTAGELSDDDVTTADLDTMNLGTTGHLALSEDSPLTFEPLITTSDAVSTVSAARFSYLPDPSVLQDGFTPRGEPLVVGARLSGNLRSAFPDGPPAGDGNADAPGGGDNDADGLGPEEAAGEAPAPDHLAESTEPANIIVVADVDMLADRMWVQVQSFLGQQIANAFASNGAFVSNALENLAGSSDLIAVRSRASYTRPFTVVEDLRVQAEARFRETEERLQSELAETERRLADLQSRREDAGNLLLTEEQQAEIDRFVDRRAQIRRELRAVQRDLDRNIEQLGTVLKVINIALVPLLLTVFVLLAVWRRKRREQR